MKQPSLIFIGHVSMDRVQNVWGERLQLGGAALYASAGARVLTEDVRLISAVGRDFEHIRLLYSSFPGSLIKRVNTATSSFRIAYDKSFQARYEAVHIGAGLSIRPSDLPAQWVTVGRPYIHLAPMHPAKTMRFIQRIRQLNPRGWVSAHTSPDYVADSALRRVIRRVAEEVDLMVVNDREAEALTESESLLTAVRALNAKRLAVTLGQLGAILVEEGRMQMIPALAGLSPTPRDTTGAGDTWCGALLATYALTGDWVRSVVTACIVSAIKCLGWSFEKLRGLRFQNPGEAVDYILRYARGAFQVSLKDFLGESPAS